MIHWLVFLRSLAVTRTSPVVYHALLTCLKRVSQKSLRFWLSTQVPYRSVKRLKVSVV
ncbi:Uncharacterised protein [Vibrio cholerae]|nr:Uncharacterised protein [Vibrio cholerae]